MVRKVIAVLVAFGSAACADGGSYQGQEAMSRATFGPGWPLTVDRGELRCEGREGSRLATFATGGRVYALNARAYGRGDGQELDPIWASDPRYPDRRADLEPLIERALQLCLAPSARPDSSAEPDTPAPSTGG